MLSLNSIMWIISFILLFSLPSSFSFLSYHGSFLACAFFLLTRPLPFFKGCCIACYPSSFFLSSFLSFFNFPYRFCPCRVMGSCLLVFSGTCVFIGVRFVSRLAPVALVCVIFSIAAIYIGELTEILHLVISILAKLQVDGMLYFAILCAITCE